MMSKDFVRTSSSEEQKSGLGTPVKIGLVLCVVVALIGIGVVAWDITYSDTWQLHNASRVLAELAKADQLQQTDPFAAYKTYDAVLKEAEGHEVTHEALLTKLANAEDSRTTLHQVVQDQLRAEEVERQHQAEAKVKREAEEKEEEEQRVVEEEKRRRAAKEAERITQEKQQAEKKRHKEAALAYRNSPQSARDTLNVLKKVEARTEVGINYSDYSKAVGEAWGEVKVFVESPEGKELPEFSYLLVSAMGKYKLGLDIWQGKLKPNSNLRYHEGLSDIMLQECWRATNSRLDVASSLISENSTAIALSQVAALHEADASYETTMRTLFPELVIAHMEKKLVTLGSKKTQKEYTVTLEKFREKLEGIIAKDLSAMNITP